MIISQITGGLGNQLFQFAAGYSVAKRLNTDLLLHFTLHEADTKRRPAIAVLIKDLQWANQDQVKHYIPTNAASRIWQRLLPFSQKVFYKESHFHYDEHIQKITDNTYLKGFWQSEIYFHNYASDIRHIIVDAISSIHLNEQLVLKLSEQNSICLHVRKGDYLAPPYNTYYHQLKNEYYKKAVQKVTLLNGNGKVYIFTDDIQWVEQHLDIDCSFELITGKQTSHYFEDLRAMMLCHHHIIANSSFSWWSAWLSSRMQKTIIAPEKWFDQGPSDTEDLIPASWIKL